MVWSRRATVVAAFVLAPVLLLGAGIALYDRTDDQAPIAAAPATVGELAGSLGATDLGTTISALQVRLQGLPEDYGSWSALGFAYIAQARATADPSYYPKAEQAFALVLDERPDDADALTGRAALANARHDFAAGRDLAQRAVELNAYDATAKGVLADALLELGEYDAALVTLQEMVDLEPGVAAFTRISYSYELRGNLDGARFALDRALEVAQTPPDISFVLFQLGELAFNEGSYEQAASNYADGLARDATNVPLLAGQAKVAAALGDIDTALRTYDTVVQRLPQPIYLVEYGELLDSVGRPNDAQEQYDVADAATLLFSAAGVQPDIETALYDADHGRPEQALATAQAQYADRKSVQVYDAMAWALHASGRDEEALEHALAAARLGTRNALWEYHRGMIQLSLGNTDDARASLVAALETSPEFSPLHAPLARDAVRTLDSAA